MSEAPTATADTEGSTDHQGPAGGGDERLAYRGLGLRMLVRPEIVGMLGAVVLYAFFWGVTRPFGSAGGVATVLDVSATLGIMAVAVAALMIGGEFDLSSGAMTGFMGIVIVLLVKETGDMGGAGLTYWLAIPISLVIALAIGWLNGTMVEKTALPSFIVTLATFFVLRGVKLAGSKIAVDQIQVGRADEGQHYDFWRKIFGSTWTRGDHVWEARDGVYTVLAVLGAVMVVLAIYEFGFRRRETMDPTGLPIAILGLAGVGVGVALMHGLDGNDWLPAIVFAVSGIVAIEGLGRWRYEPLENAQPLNLQQSITRPALFGVGALVVAVVSALAFDPYNDDDLFLLVTKQGARAILFIGFVAVAAGFFFVAVYRSRHVSERTKAATMALVAVLTALMALFIQSESESRKFRAELFTWIMVAALLIGLWAYASTRFRVRRYEDASADRLARIVGAAGGVLVILAIVIRLLFAVQAELDANDPSRLALFSIRIVWFLGFAAVMTWVLGSSKFGSWVYAVGGNKEAARQVGVPAARTKTQLFMLVAFAAWLVGILLAFRLNTIQAGTGNGEEFEYIIAAVVGGTLLTGGFGSALGAAIGAFIMAMAQQGISFAGWNTDWRFVFLGGILLVAVYTNGYVRRVAEGAR